MGAVVLMLAVGAAPATRAEEAASTTKREHRSKGRWQLHLGGSFEYDTNVLEYSAVDRAKIGDPAYADRFSISRADDILFRPELGMSWSRNLLRQRSTEVSFELDPVLHVHSTLLNQETWSLGVDQELGRDRRPTMNRIGLSLATTPHVTLRRLKDDDVSLQLGRVVREDSVYSQRGAHLDGTVELVKQRMALDLDVNLSRRDYIDTFDERDGRITEWKARLVGHADPRGRVRLRLGWQDGRYDGEGDDPATPLVEDDISSDRSIWAFDARYAWGKGDAAQRVSATVERELRDYTAPSPFDVYHHGRHDERWAWGFAWRRSLPHDLAVTVELSGEGNRSTFSIPPPPNITPGDATDYDTTLVSAGLSWRFDW